MTAGAGAGAGEMGTAGFPGGSLSLSPLLS